MCSVVYMKGKFVHETDLFHNLIIPVYFSLCPKANNLISCARFVRAFCIATYFSFVFKRAKLNTQHTEIVQRMQ